MDGFCYGVKRDTQASFSSSGAEQVSLPLQKQWNPVAGTRSQEQARWQDAIPVSLDRFIGFGNSSKCWHSSQSIR